MLKRKVSYAQSIIKLSHILLSCMHVWTIEPNLDKMFVDRLNLQKPKYPVAFGRISRGAHLFVMFPPKRALLGFDDLAKPLIDLDEEKCFFDLNKKSNEPETPSPTRETWLSTKQLTTEHLLAILAISNSFMNLSNFIDLQMKQE